MNQQTQLENEKTNIIEVDLSKPETVPSLPFADLTLNIPDMTENVVGHDGGIKKRLVDRDKGVRCLLRPYLYMAENDTVELFCVNTVTSVDSHLVTQYEVDKRLDIPLYIPFLRLPEGSVAPVFFRVTRNAGGATDETKHFKLKVDTLEPGGRDPIPSTPRNENLSKPIFDATIIDNGVTEQDADNGVPVHINYYPVDQTLPAGHHRTTRDVILLSIDGVIIEHTVTEGEAATRDPIKIIVYKGDWVKIGSGERICEWSVRDEAGNYSLGSSPMQLISVYLRGATQPLPAARIEDVNNNGELDLDKLNGADTTIIVPIAEVNDYQEGDLLIIEAAGRTEDHVSITKYFTYEVLFVTRDARVNFPYADAWPLVKGDLRLRYERIRSGVTPNRGSRVRVINIIGTGNSRGLPPPVVLEAPDGNLKPDSVIVTVQIESFSGQTEYAGITVKLAGTYANGTGYYREIGPRPAGTGKVTFRIINGPDGEIARLEGGTLDISYIVTPEEPGPSRESDTLHIVVGDSVPSLPAPRVEEAPPPDFIYNPEVSMYGATIVAAKNIAFTLNSEVTMHFEGRVAGGSASPQKFKITQNWLNKDLYFYVDQSIVEKNKGYTANAYFTLSKPNERTRFSHAVTIKVGAPLVLPEPEVLQATVISPGNATLNPAHVLTPALFTIRVRYSPMLDTHRINVSFDGAIGPGTPLIPSKSGNSAQGFVDFEVNNKAIAANLTGGAIVAYEVVNAAGKTPSKKLTLEIQPLPSSLLDVVSIPEAVGRVIDVNRKNSVLTLEYPFMGSNQAYFINLKGQSDRLLTGKVSPEEYASRKIMREIPPDYLTSQPNGGHVTVEVSVSLNDFGDINSATPLVVPPPYRIKKAIGIVKNIDVGGTPTWLVASPNGKFIYVTNNTTHSVSVIDTSTDRVVHTITGLNSPYSIAVHPDGSLLYVGNLGDKTVSVFSTFDYKELLPRIPGFNAPHGIFINDRATRMYVTCNAGGYIYVHDVASRGRIESIKIQYPTGIVLNPSNSRLYIADYSRVAILDTSTNQLIGTGIPGFNYPRDIAYSSHNTATPRIYLTNQNSNNVIIVNAGTNIIHKTLGNFLQPYGVAVNPVIEHAYVTENTGNSLKIIDINTDEVIETFNGLNQPRGVAVLPDGSKFYVASAGGHAVTVFAA